MTASRPRLTTTRRLEAIDTTVTVGDLLDLLAGASRTTRVRIARTPAASPLEPAMVTVEVEVDMADAQPRTVCRVCGLVYAREGLDGTCGEACQELAKERERRYRP